MEKGKEVERLTGDHAGRKGTVVDTFEGRARVLWHTETKRLGSKPIKMRTWVKYSDLKIIG